MAFKENILATYKDEKSALGEVRQLAKKQLEVLELPTRKNEDWKFTNVKSLDKIAYSFEEAKLTNSQVKAVEIEGLDAYKIILVNGVFDSEKSVLPTQNKVTVLPLVEALKDETTLAYFNQELNTENELFSAISTALFKDGYFIKIEKKYCFR